MSTKVAHAWSRLAPNVEKISPDFNNGTIAIHLPVVHTKLLCAYSATTSESTRSQRVHVVKIGVLHKMPSGRTVIGG